MSGLRTQLRISPARGLRHCARSRRGFTLIELVLALGMVAVLALTLSASMRIAFRMASSAEAAVVPGRDAQVSLNYLGNDLRNAMQTGGQLAGTFEGTQNTDSRGHEADDVIFYSTSESPQHVAANGEIKMIELTTEQASNGDFVLIRRVTRNLLSQVAANPDEEVICRGVSSFTLQYFDGTYWNPTWDSTAEDNTIPAAVQVTLEIDRPEADGTNKTSRSTQIFLLPCSTAPTDQAVNPSLGGS